MAKKLLVTKGAVTDGCWHSSTGVSPRPMLMGAPRNAMRAFNAGVSLSCLYVVARKLPLITLRRGGLAPLFPVGEKYHGAPAARLGTDRMCRFAL